MLGLDSGIHACPGAQCAAAAYSCLRAGRFRAATFRSSLAGATRLKHARARRDDTQCAPTGQKKDEYVIHGNLVHIVTLSSNRRIDTHFGAKRLVPEFYSWSIEVLLHTKRVSEARSSVFQNLKSP
jgi:hypothetical protein